MPDRIDAFVEAVGAEIRWKKARSPLTEEIRTHLLDQRDAYMAQGMDEDKAQTEAVRQMGDPAMLGADLDRVHRPRPQWGLLLMALALIFVYPLGKKKVESNVATLKARREGKK